MQMTKYIKRDSLRSEILGLTIVDPAVAQYADAVLMCVENAPGADVAPVVHGMWEGVCQDGACSWSGRCSVCGTRNDIPHPLVANYCPSCGAKMDLG